MIDALFLARVAQFGAIPAVVDPLNRETLMDGPARTLTWPELDEEISRLAQVLLEEGVCAGDVVGVQLPNTIEIVVAFLAIVGIGAIVAPFPVQYRAYELTRLSSVAQVKMFITGSRIGQRPAAAEIAGLAGQIPSPRALARPRRVGRWPLSAAPCPTAACRSAACRTAACRTASSAWTRGWWR